jgi:hypothetical protein
MCHGILLDENIDLHESNAERGMKAIVECHTFEQGVSRGVLLLGVKTSEHEAQQRSEITGSNLSLG